MKVEHRNAPREIVASHGLSPMQEGMLYQAVSKSRPGININQLYFDTADGLDVVAFSEAWRRVVDRHDVLRTSFRWSDVAAPTQDVHARVELPIAVHDWTAFAPADAADAVDAHFAELLAADRRRGFDLSAAPATRLTLLRTSPAGRHRVLWTFHHILIDGRSILLVLDEVFRLYEAEHAGRSPSLPPSVPFREYTEWSAASDWTAARAFWSELLAGFSTPARLGNAASGVAESATAEVALSPETTAALRALADQTGVTLATTVQCAWGLLLARYTGEDDVVFGGTRACRRYAGRDASGTVGLFINTVPVRLRLSDDTTTREALCSLRAQWVAMRDHEHYPLGRIQQRDQTGGGALFESILVAEGFDWRAEVAARGRALGVHAVAMAQRTSYPLTIGADLGERIVLSIEHDPSAIHETTGRAILSGLARVLEGMAGAGAADVRVWELPVLGDDEERRLDAWAVTPAGFAQDKTLPELIGFVAEQLPEAVAVSAGERTLTYRDLMERSRALAAALHHAGIAYGRPVGLCVRRRLSLPVGVLGILRSGGAYLPLDAADPIDRLTYKLEDSGVRVVVAERGLAENLPRTNGVPIRVIELGDDGVLSDDDSGRAADDAPPPHMTPHPDGPAYVIYTSGSTGRPNGVVVPHRALVNHAVALAHEYELGPADRVPQFASMAFDLSLEEMLPTWLAGARLVLRPDEVRTPGELLDWSRRERLTVLNLPTAFWGELAADLYASKLRGNGAALPPDVRLVMTGGEGATAASYRAWRAAVGEHVRWLNCYGPTEATITATVFDPRRADAAALDTPIVPIGRPVANVRAYVLDRRGRRVPATAQGELYLGGPGLADGYLGRPELTAARFVPDPFAGTPGARMYKTGDRARWLHDGTLEFCGRVDKQLKVRGYRIEPGEIESVLEEHPEVSAAVVLAAKDDGGVARLVAYVASTFRPEPTVLRAHLRRKLPDFMVPSAFVVVDRLPVNMNGKVDRDSLPEAPLPTAAGNERSVAAARNPFEEVLLNVWRETIGDPTLGVHDDFFDAGGNSLLTLKIAARAGYAGLRVTPEMLFQNRTVADLARAVTQAFGAHPDWSSIVAMRAGGARPPLFLVHSTPGDVFGYVNLVSRLGADQPCFGLQSLGLRSPGAAHVDLRSMARYYVDELQNARFRGPYHLAGWCYGGIVAYEMAQELHARGEEVAFVGLVDAAAPRPALSHVDYYVERARCVARMGVRGLARYASEKLKASLGDRRQNARALLEVEVDHGPLANRAHVMDANMRAVLAYKPLPYAGRVTLFCTSEPMPGTIVDPTLGWRTLAAEIDRHEIAAGAGHASIMHEPHAGVLAKSLRRAMDAASPAMRAEEAARIKTKAIDRVAGAAVVHLAAESSWWATELASFF